MMVAAARWLAWGPSVCQLRRSDGWVFVAKASFRVEEKLPLAPGGSSADAAVIPMVLEVSGAASMAYQPGESEAAWSNGLHVKDAGQGLVHNAAEAACERGRFWQTGGGIVKKPRGPLKRISSAPGAVESGG